jgi:TrmH family RNA methyltransferase
MLTSLQNPLVKQMRKLHRAKERREQSLFLVEGTHLIEAACTAGFSLETLCYTAAWQAKYPDLWQQVAQMAGRVELVSEEVLQAVATTVNPDGVIATAQRLTSSSLSGGSSLDDSMATPQLGIALETLQDPGNLGTVIRTAAAVGADGLWLSQDSVDLDHPKVLRASAGQWFRLPMRVSQNLQADLQQLQCQGVQIVATLPTARLSYWQVDFTSPTIVVLGNEGAGLTDPIAELSDVAVKIPLAPGVESLNVAIAAALLLYEAQRQRLANPHGVLP